MKKIIVFVFVLVFLSESNAQQPQISLDSMVQKLSNSLERVESISYSAVLRIKKFKSEDFKEKRFEVFARKNANGNGYNFDWEIVEYIGDSEQRYIFMGKEFFYINKIAKVIGYSNNLNRLSFGDYFEAMRRSTLFDEMIYSFNSIYMEKAVTLVNENNEGGHFQIMIEIDSLENRILTLNNHSFLPNSAKNIVRYREMNLIQIIETDLSDIKINLPFPDSILMPQFYLNQEYTVKYEEQEKDANTTTDTTRIISSNNIRQFFDFPMINYVGDTLQLDDISGELFLIDFWYMSCIPCLKSIPHLQNLYEKYSDKGLRVIGINCYDSSSKNNVIKKLNENGVTYQNYFADKSMLKLLRINAFPTFFVIDKNKNVKFLGVGVGKDFDSLIEEEINKLK